MFARTAHWIAIGSLLLTFACQKNDGPPAAAPSTDSAAYAQHYPAQLQALSTRYEVELSSATEIVDKFASYPDALNDPDWTVVDRSYARADEEGRGQAYANQREREAVILAFYTDERKSLVSRVAGANQHAAKEKGHDIKLYGPTDWALERGISESLEERRRRTSDAHAQLKAKEKELGKKNFDALSEQCDQIALASYVAHVGAATNRYELEALAKQGSDARSTLEKRREQLAEDPNADEDEVAAVNEALTQLDPAVEKANQQLKDAEQKHKDLEANYDKAFDALMEVVAQKVAAAPPEIKE